MKRCSSCAEHKVDSDFSKNAKRKDGLQAECKICKQRRDRDYYHEDESRKHAVTARRHRAIIRNREVVFEHLMKNHCVDCGNSDFRVLEFDHVNGNKVTEIAHMIRNGFSELTLKAEMAKCEIRCANCHRIKTNHGSWRDLIGVRSTGRTSDSGSENEGSTPSPRTKPKQSTTGHNLPIEVILDNLSDG